MQTGETDSVFPHVRLLHLIRYDSWGGGGVVGWGWGGWEKFMALKLRRLHI